MHRIKRFLRFYFLPLGRMSRVQWWLALFTGSLWVQILFGSLSLLFDPQALDAFSSLPDLDSYIDSGSPKSSMSVVMDSLGIDVFAGIFLSTSIKRFHDRDKHTWWLCLLAIPIIGPLWFMIELGFLRGTKGPNRYGMV